MYTPKERLLQNILNTLPNAEKCKIIDTDGSIRTGARLAINHDYTLIFLPDVFLKTAHPDIRCALNKQNDNEHVKSFMEIIKTQKHNQWSEPDVKTALQKLIRSASQYLKEQSRLQLYASEILDDIDDGTT